MKNRHVLQSLLTVLLLMAVQLTGQLAYNEEDQQAAASVRTNICSVKLIIPTANATPSEAVEGVVSGKLRRGFLKFVSE